jgi:Zn-dependent M28 family amino/carboxypeptidase
MRKSIGPLIIFVLISFFSHSLYAQSKDQGLNIEPLPGIMEEVKSLERPSNLERLESLKKMMDKRAISYKLEEFENTSERPYPRKEGVNIVVTIGSGLKDIVLGAHWDAAYLGRENLSTGGIDNGCAAVILIRAAEELQKLNLNHRIRIVLFDMEEIGLVGSGKYIEMHKNDQIESVINIDVCGFGNTLFFGARNSAGNNKIYKTYKTVCVENDFNFIEFPQYPSSDHLSFQKAGIDNISISILPADIVHQFWLEINGHGNLVNGSAGSRINIHSSEDNSSNVDPAAMSIVYKSVIETVKKLDATYVK